MCRTPRLAISTRLRTVKGSPSGTAATTARTSWAVSVFMSKNTSLFSTNWGSLYHGITPNHSGMHSSLNYVSPAMYEDELA